MNVKQAWRRGRRGRRRCERSGASASAFERVSVEGCSLALLSALGGCRLKDAAWRSSVQLGPAWRRA